jgi:succinate-semialdehyde dehydrogenase/glutarate-semialdehyde dehydrogenase
MQLKSINPATGELLNVYDEYQYEEMDQILDQCSNRFKTWRKEPLSLRVHLLRSLARLLREKKDNLALTITLEMGKPIKESRSEVEKCAWVCDYYAENAQQFLTPEVIATEATQSYAIFNPLGTILAVMPWNFPFWQVFRFAAPAIVAGNTAVLKHASNVPACALVIEQLFLEAGFPEGVFRTMLVTSGKVEKLITSKRIKAITLTGSTPAGKTVAATAGQHLKKTVLELGGSDPYIVLEDANITQAVNACVAGRLLNTGQSCIGAKRFIVVESVYRDFEEQFVAKMQAARMGDPLNEENQLGPMARMNIREDLHMQVLKSVNMGATVLCGGTFPDQPGYYYPATVLTDLTPGMPAYSEELFGPVASLICVEDEAQAINVANDTSFGLGAAVFTSDLKRGQRIAEEELDAGCCFVNDFVRSDPRLPFGGIKESGYGRELSHYGMKEFLNIKTIWIK